MAMICLAVTLLLSGCTTERVVLEPKPVPNSTVIDAKVHQLLAMDPQLKGVDIKVNTFQGHVMLDGVVNTDAQREQATKLAWGVAGVVGVENNLLLQSEKKR